MRMLLLFRIIIESDLISLMKDFTEFNPVAIGGTIKKHTILTTTSYKKETQILADYYGG